MKEKKSNYNSKVNIDDDQKQALIKLVGLFLIVYGILCLASGEIGCILSVPFTFLVGSFSPIVLFALIIVGCYMLFFKKGINKIKPLQCVLLSLMGVFLLVLSSATKSTQDMTLADCFQAYVGKNGIYRYNYRFIISNESESVYQLGGGMLGYMFYGLINTITGSRHIITIVISSIILFGVSFIFFTPYIKKLIKWIKAKKKIINEKKEAKKRKQLEEKEKEEKLKEERNKNSSPVKFNVSTFEQDSNLSNKSVDDLLETTEINITGEDFTYVRNSDSKKNKLDAILSNYDEEIYPENMKKGVSDSIILEVTDEVKINDIFEDDFKTEEIVTEVTDISESNKEEVNEVILSEEQVIEEQTTPSEVILQEISSKDNINLIPDEKETSNDTLIINNDTEIKEEFIIKDENNKIVGGDVDLDDANYTLPPLYLLKEASDNGANAINEAVAKEKAMILMEKMKELNVNASINTFVVGPSVTRFEISLAPGVRVGSFTNLQEDFKLALGVNSIRIESPIPGKSAIGIEVPNKERAMVSMKEIITKMPDKKHKLYVPVGKDIAGTPLSFPICDMPHCLISGATNSGKSVCANTIILSLLMNYKPSEVRLIMVDPKRVEMLFYKDIPHLVCPIITEAEKARVALNKLCVEMDKRFSSFSEIGVKNIASYNEVMVKEKKKKMPFLLLVVDEFAELMLCKSHAIVEEKIQRIAQLGRAAGIHLILSTQRPDVNVIPGTIKTNLPCRMTFRLSSLADSRTVIDVGGAEKLLNNGDMLLLTPDFTGLRRVQGVYVSDSEIADVVEFCKKQMPPQYDPAFMDLRTEEEKEADEKLKYISNGNTIDEDKPIDPLYEEIKRFVIKEQKASTSFLIRKFSIGYGKAARYIDMLEEEGIVGPENGSRPREVLVSSEDEL